MKAARFRGLAGVVHSMDELPVKTPGMRWGHVAKALVLGAYRAGALTEDDLAERYDLSLEELKEWGARYDAHGFAGLKITKKVAPNVANMDRGRSAARSYTRKGSFA